MAGKESAKGGHLSRARFGVAIVRFEGAFPSYRETVANHRLTSDNASRTAGGAVDCGVCFAATEARAVTRAWMSLPNRSLTASHSSALIDAKSRPSAWS